CGWASNSFPPIGWPGRLRQPRPLSPNKKKKEGERGRGWRSKKSSLGGKRSSGGRSVRFDQGQVSPGRWVTEVIRDGCGKLISKQRNGRTTQAGFSGRRRTR